MVRIFTKSYKTNVSKLKSCIWYDLGSWSSLNYNSLYFIRLKNQGLFLLGMEMSQGHMNDRAGKVSRKFLHEADEKKQNLLTYHKVCLSFLLFTQNQNVFDVNAFALIYLHKVQIFWYPKSCVCFAKCAGAVEWQVQLTQASSQKIVYGFLHIVWISSTGTLLTVKA